MSDTFWRDLERDKLWQEFWESERVKRAYAYWMAELKTAADMRALGLAQGHIQCLDFLRDLPAKMAAKAAKKDH